LLPATDDTALDHFDDLDLSEDTATEVTYPSDDDTVPRNFIAYGGSTASVNFGRMVNSDHMKDYSFVVQGSGTVWFLTFMDVPVGEGYTLTVKDDQLGMSTPGDIEVADPFPPL